MAKALDLVNQRFGKLYVIKREENDKRGGTQWLCRCDCGKQKIALGYDLTHGRTVSCGCNLKGTESKKRIDLTGKQFGNLTVISLNEEKSQNGKLIWKCQCRCGNMVDVAGGNLKDGHTTSCGCIKHKRPSTFVDLTNMRYGKLRVVSYYGKSNKHIMWNCLCDCGKECVVGGSELKSGKTKSCGCYAKEAKKEAKHKITHGMSKTRLYKEWGAMKKRCDPEYHLSSRYYDRGITVCEEWQKFEPFRDWAIQNGYNEELSIDRIDNNKGYSPDNCRWVGNDIQQNNKSANVYIEIDGETKTLKQWSDYFGVSYNMVKARYRYGWDKDRLFIPKTTHK